MSNSAMTRVACLALLCLGSQAAVAGTDRQWAKYHQDIVEDCVTYAQFTKIFTSDRRSPNLVRYLYQDETGERLIVRSSADFAWTEGAAPTIASAQESIELLGTGEMLTVSTSEQGALTVTVGNVAYALADGDEIPFSSSQTALAILNANASQAFREALERFTNVNSTLTTAHHPALTFALRRLFYRDVPAGAIELASEPRDIVSPFNPNSTPEGFDAGFGSAFGQ